MALVVTLLGACQGAPPPAPVAVVPTPPPPVAPVAPVDAAVVVDAAVQTPPAFGIGGGERDPLTHVAFETPTPMTAVTVRVVVDRTAAVGLNFFALQVDFTNGTWAHGGVQDVDGPDGTRTRQVNWGGLVDRGGGTADYDEEDDLVDLDKIQNAPPGQHVGPYAWRTGVTYEYRIERGAQVTLPPGDYRLIPDRPIVYVAHARTMWAWRFTITPMSEAGAPFVATLYDSADSIGGISVWNESGYGSTAAAQHTTWWLPRYGLGGAAATQLAPTWDRF